MSRKTMRVQLQLGHNDIVPSQTYTADEGEEITNAQAVKVVQEFERICKADSTFKKEVGQRALNDGFQKIYRYLHNVKEIGAQPSGNGNITQSFFMLNNDQYRIDLEAQGKTAGDAVFFK